MRDRSGRLVFSPSDLIVFVESPFASWMDRLHRERPGEIVPDGASDEDAFVAEMGGRHEKAELEKYRARGRDVWSAPEGDAAFDATLDAMRAGREIIYQGALRDGDFEGRTDFLIRVDRPSSLWAWSYEVADAKLARKPKPYFLIQLCAYAQMLEHVQGVRPARIRILAGDGTEHLLRTDDYFFHFRAVERAFREMQGAFDPGATPPLPEASAEHRRWASHAERILEQLDHPSRVAGITSLQVKRLATAGITTTKQLAESTLAGVRKMDPGTFAKLRQQARLQRESATLDRPRFERIAPDDHGSRRGLQLLPPPSQEDIFFDMEGYPFVEGGLEYLFGATSLEGAERAFVDFWAHDAAAERKALEAFVDWVWERHERDRGMHIYHYGSYEVAALRRLMGRHGTREDRIDALLRAGAFVDLLTVVRQGFRIGEPSYSLKNVERLYRAGRAGDVTTAGQSVVAYARWLEAPDGDEWRSSKTLASIRAYNRDDCESTLELRDWLLAQQKEARIDYVPPFNGEPRKPDAQGEGKPKEKPGEVLAKRLLDALPQDRSTDPERWRIQELLAHLVLFHKREQKPMWWRVFDRELQTHEQLADDVDCIGGLVRTPTAARVDGAAAIYEYRFDPDQDTKLDEGSVCYVLPLRLDATIESIARDKGLLSLRVARRQGEPAESISLIPNEYVPTDSIEKSICATAEAWIAACELPRALDTLLRRALPEVHGRDRGAPLPDAKTAVLDLRESALAIQGPPGAGKTAAAAKAIVELVARGQRVGVSSNSHSAIEKLLRETLDAADKQGVRVSATKVRREADEAIVREGRAVHAETMKQVVLEGSRAARLVGGTAWAFSSDAAAGRFDYLFVDEAGQVSLANLVAMSRAAKNLVLLGDQMQLSQPTQGAHPGESGASALGYLLAEHRTIPPELGVFLGTSWRMHPAVCRFVSGAFYDGRLEPDPDSARRIVRVPDGARLIQVPSGIVFVPALHEGNAQASDEEVAVVKDIVAELCGRAFVDKDGNERRIGPGDFLVVAPYNMQVRRLERALPGVRVGSVDKFQGQQAPIVIVSMCASSAEGSPRGLEFLLSANRLNVAVSRAFSLAVVVGSPRLGTARATTIEQMRLTNTFCRIIEESEANRAEHLRAARRRDVVPRGRRGSAPT